MLLALLWAPNSGGLMMIGDVAQVMCDKLLGDTAGEDWLPECWVCMPLVVAIGRQVSVDGLAGFLQDSVGVGLHVHGVPHLYTDFYPAPSCRCKCSQCKDSPRRIGFTAGGWRWLANGNTLMVLVTIFVVLPLSCQKHMRSLQHAATAGMLVVAGLCALLVYKAADAGMPAVASGEFKLWSFKVCGD